MLLKLYFQSWLLICAFSSIVWSVRIGQVGSRNTTEPLWTNWSQCFGKSNVKFQMRNCLKACTDKKLEIRECSVSQNCSAHKALFSPVNKFGAKVSLEIYTNTSWRSFCHPTWDINLANEVCKAYGFPKADAVLNEAYSGHNDSRAVILKSNKTACDGLNSHMFSRCDNVNRAVAVCKVPVRIDGSYAGKVYLFHNGTWKYIAMHEWTLTNAKVICRQLDFKDAIAPFSTNSTLVAKSNKCVPRLHCSGKEAFLGSCFLNISSTCNPSSEGVASVTCDPKNGFHRVFRIVLYRRLDSRVASSCNLSSPIWYDVNNNTITNSTRRNIFVSANNGTMVISSLTLEDAGVYFCVGSSNRRMYGTVIIYVRAPSNKTSTRIFQGQGEQIISCDTYGVPQPIVLPNWWKNGMRLSVSRASSVLGNSHRLIINENNSLVIRQPRRDDKGAYSCETLQVYENSALKRQKLVFHVVVDANPCSLHPCNGQGNCTLTENGTFICRCFGGYRGTFCEILGPTTTLGTPVTHLDTPVVFINAGNESFEVGDDVLLKCMIEKTKWFVTAQWIKHGTNPILTQQNFSASVLGSVKTFHTFRYRIYSLSLDDSGVYTCKATFWNSSLQARPENYKLRVRVPSSSDEDGEANEEDKSKSIVVSLGVTSALLFICIVIGLVCHKKRLADQRIERTREMADNLALERMESDSDKRYLSLTASCWDISSKAIVFQNVLGSGSFGEVWKAVASGIKGISGETVVAVKKLKHNSSNTEKESLAQEIELGKSLDGDRHPNIVNFLGCVSTSNPMMLILEYVAYGDLLGYLRKSRGMEDKYYSCSESCEQEVTSYDLLSFAQQIASGMSFLASKKILHRDLAARNVLVGKGMICKITDFGLALIRDKYQYLYCTAIRKGRLPIKWTAPEHLFNDSPDKDVRVSEKSDVWSYGVVLYEIYTLGGVPYPGWNEWKVVYELKVNKYRMSQPEHVSNELYQMMLDCWNDDPNDRPTFDRLYEITTEFLQNEYYVDLDLSKYESSLYTDVEEINTSVNDAASLEHGNIAAMNDISKDPNEATKKDIGP